MMVPVTSKTARRRLPARLLMVRVTAVRSPRLLYASWARSTGFRYVTLSGPTHAGRSAFDRTRLTGRTGPIGMAQQDRVEPMSQA